MRQDTSEDLDLGYIKCTLSSTEGTHIDPKELRNKGYAKTFNQWRLYLDNGLISYHDTPRTARVRRLRRRVIPVKFRRVVISACHVSPLAGHIHYKRPSFRIPAQFWWPMVNKKMAQFIRVLKSPFCLTVSYHAGIGGRFGVCGIPMSTEGILVINGSVPGAWAYLTVWSTSKSLILPAVKLLCKYM